MASAINTYPLFVYGTLKRGFGNHHFLQHSHFIDTAHTKLKYALYVSGIPFVTEKVQVSRIYGEVYMVTEPTLKRIDALEGHPVWYCRKLIPVLLDKGGEINAWLYFNDRPTGSLVSNGIFTG